MFSEMFEHEETPATEARLPQIHARELMRVMQRFARSPRRLADLSGKYLGTEMFHEANAQRDGALTRQDSPAFQPCSPDEWVISLAPTSTGSGRHRCEAISRGDRRWWRSTFSLP